MHTVFIKFSSQLKRDMDECGWKKTNIYIYIYTIYIKIMFVGKKNKKGRVSREEGGIYP